MNMRLSVLNYVFIFTLNLILLYVNETNGSWHACQSPVLKHGIVKMINGVAQFECMLGYELSGSLYSACVDSIWKPDIPACIKSGCEKITSPKNGEIIYLKSNAYVIFICKPNYTLVGPTALYCDGMKWNDKRPSCIEADPADNENGELTTEIIKEEPTIETTTLSDLERYFNEIRFIKEQNSILESSVSHPTEPHQSTHCSQPEFRHGDIRLRNRGQTVRYICWEGYELWGDRNSYCVDGNWSSQAPFCIKPGCDRLPLLQHGVEIFTKRDALVKFMCKRGYHIDRSTTIHCDGSKWNDTLPTCTEKGSCATPTFPNGLIKWRSRGRQVRFKCLEGFKLIGNTYSTCLNGKWTQELPVCVSDTNPLELSTEQVFSKDDDKLTKSESIVTEQTTNVSTHSTDVTDDNIVPEVSTLSSIGFTDIYEFFSTSTPSTEESLQSLEEFIQLIQDDDTTANYYLDRIKNYWIQ